MHRLLQDGRGLASCHERHRLCLLHEAHLLLVVVVIVVVRLAAFSLELRLVLAWSGLSVSTPVLMRAPHSYSLASRSVHPHHILLLLLLLLLLLFLW
jgi:hypothetical protein